jgi:hypothetical protein
MPIRFMVSDQKIAEVRVSQNSAIGVECLFEDFLAVRSEKQARPLTEAITLTLVIERGDDGFPRSCRGNHKIAPVADRALGFKRFNLNSAVEKTRMAIVTPLPELVGRYFRVLVG